MKTFVIQNNSNSFRPPPPMSCTCFGIFEKNNDENTPKKYIMIRSVILMLFINKKKPLIILKVMEVTELKRNFFIHC